MHADDWSSSIKRKTADDVSKQTWALIVADRQHLVHPHYEFGQSSGIIFERSHGVYLVDVEGNEYIDMASGNCCCNLGHGQQRIWERVIEATKMIDFVTPLYGHSNLYIIECAQKLAKLTPGSLKRFYFTSGGSEAVDTSVKIARLYWHIKGMSQKYKIISLYDSFHGATGFSTYVTGMGRGTLQSGFGPVAPGFVHIPSYYCYRCMLGLKYPECGVRCALMLEDIIQAEGAESVAAIIVEGMIGAGGCIEPPPRWWPIIDEICKKYDILIIDDEVMSGFARTSKMFAVDHWNIEPDIMTMAKGINSAYLPFGAVAINDMVFEGLKGSQFMHGATNPQHPVVAASACAALDIYVADNLVDNVATVGMHIRRRLDAEFAPLSCVGDISGKGFLVGIEFVTDRESKTPIDPQTKAEAWQKLYESGVYTRFLGRHGNRLNIGPPCIITQKEADKALDIILSVMCKLKPRKHR